MNFHSQQHMTGIERTYPESQSMQTEPSDSYITYHVNRLPALHAVGAENANEVTLSKLEATLAMLTERLIGIEARLDHLEATDSYHSISHLDTNESYHHERNHLDTNESYHHERNHLEATPRKMQGRPVSERPVSSRKKKLGIEGYCWYHNRFGKDATKCGKPCSWKPEQHMDCPELISKFEESRKLEDNTKKELPEKKRKQDGTDEGSGKKKKISAEENNSPRGFNRDLVPEKIIGVTDSCGEVMFLIKWKDRKEADLVPAKQAHVKYPQIVIQYYEERLTWYTRNHDKDGDKDKDGDA